MDIDFLKISKKEELANYLSITVKQLDYNAYNTKGKYNEFSVSKKDGTKRKILAPIPTLKTIQKILSLDLLNLYEPKPHVHSYLKKKRIRTNAKKHVNQKYILNIDLENFFPSINFGRVSGMFKSYPFNFNSEIANLLAQICCHENELPQGSPTSPIISNFITRNLDNQLKKLARESKCYYTRYSDDITFSTSLFRFPTSIAKQTDSSVNISKKLLKIIVDNGFKVKESKISLRRKFERQYVTGLTVNVKLNVKREFIRNLRAMIYAWEKHGLQNASKEHFNKYSVRHKGKKDPALFIKIIEGKLLFISDIRGKENDLFLSLLNKYRSLSPTNNLSQLISYQGDKIQVFTEGNTDWIHLKNALSRFYVGYKYVHLKKSIKIHEYNPNITVGDSKLIELLRGHLLSGNKNPIIAIFDSDNISSLGEFAPIKERRYNNYEGRVYTFHLPKPSHRKTNKNCIEHYYKDYDLTITDDDGRRIYLSNEFDDQSGELKNNKTIRCHASRKKLYATEGIIDTDVRDDTERSLALSKKGFAMNILNRHRKFAAVNTDSFKLIFDIIIDIMRDINNNGKQ